MTSFRLAAVLRARKAREDQAKIAAATARATADAALRIVINHERSLDGWNLPTESTARSFSASMNASHALATSLNDSLRVVTTAEEEAHRRVDNVKAAAAQRRALEHLAQRHKAAQRRQEELVEQLTADDLASAAHYRKHQQS